MEKSKTKSSTPEDQNGIVGSIGEVYKNGGTSPIIYPNGLPAYQSGLNNYPNQNEPVAYQKFPPNSTIRKPSPKGQFLAYLVFLPLIYKASNWLFVESTPAGAAYLLDHGGVWGAEPLALGMATLIAGYGLTEVIAKYAGGVFKAAEKTNIGKRLASGYEKLEDKATRRIADGSIALEKYSSKILDRVQERMGDKTPKYPSVATSV